MKHQIDPTVDCVFKALLGAEENKNLLIHFLNAVLELTENKKIVGVKLLNPYLEKEFQTDKLSIVDVRVKDNLGTTYQVDIQLSVHSSLKERMLFNWCKIYTDQMREGNQYTKLKPVVAIWILVDSLLINSSEFYHCFKIYDPSSKVIFSEGFSLCTLELNKAQIEKVKTEKERWTMLFKKGKFLDDTNLPEFMKTPEMRQAMDTMIQFSEKERNHHLYLKREEYLMVQQAFREDQEKIKSDYEGMKSSYEGMMSNYEGMKSSYDGMKSNYDGMKSNYESIKEQKQAVEQQASQTAQEKEQAIQEKKLAEQKAERYLEALKKAGVDLENL
jgi:predicted transposase/invertase (TIGR01784 family)